MASNVNNVFRLSLHLEKNDIPGILGPVNQRLPVPGDDDRLSSGDRGIRRRPALAQGCHMTVTVTVLDVNDNQPAFNYATLPEYTTVSSSILQVQATNVDDGDNGMVEYTISRRQSDKDGYFVEDRRTDVIFGQPAAGLRDAWSARIGSGGKVPERPAAGDDSVRHGVLGRRQRQPTRHQLDIPERRGSRNARSPASSRRFPTRNRNTRTWLCRAATATSGWPRWTTPFTWWSWRCRLTWIAAQLHVEWDRYWHGQPITALVQDVPSAGDGRQPAGVRRARALGQHVRDDRAGHIHGPGVGYRRQRRRGWQRSAHVQDVWYAAAVVPGVPTDRRWWPLANEYKRSIWILYNKSPLGVLPKLLS